MVAHSTHGVVGTASAPGCAGGSGSSCGCAAPGTADMVLVTAVLRRDRKATADFVNTCTDAVYTFIHRRLSPRHDLVDDLVQEVFLSAWESLRNFRGDSSLRSWLLGIARHKVEDYYRKLLRAADQLNDDAAGELVARSTGIDEMQDQFLTERRAGQVLAALPEHYSAALRWRYWEKRTARQMAEASGCTEKAVERLLYRAREEFRRRWTE